MSKGHSIQEKMQHQLIANYTQGNLASNLLLTGPTGIGKLLLAQTLAQHILGIAPNKTLSSHPDYHQCGLDSSHTIGIDQVRSLISTVQQTTHSGKHRVILIEPADALSLSAMNALLKTLEEPSHNYFFLITSQKEKLPATILSRCQSISLSPPNPSVARQWLSQQLLHKDSDYIDELLYFSFSRPTDALAIDQQQNLIHYQTMRDKLLLLIDDQLTAPELATYAHKQFSILITCLQRLLYHDNLTSHAEKLLTHAPLTLSNCWQWVVTLQTWHLKNPNMNIELSLIWLFNKIIKTLNHKDTL